MVDGRGRGVPSEAHLGEHPGAAGCVGAGASAKRKADGPVTRSVRNMQRSP